MKRDMYLKIVNLYRSEHNLSRLIYRLLKNEEYNLTYDQVKTRTFKITGDYEKLKELSNSCFKNLKGYYHSDEFKSTLGFSADDIELIDVHTNIFTTYVKFRRGKRIYGQTIINEKTPVYMEYTTAVRLLEILLNDAIQVIIDSGFIESYEVVEKTSLGKEKSRVTKFKCLK